MDENKIFKIKKSIDALKMAFRLNGAILLKSIPIDLFRKSYVIGSQDGPSIPEESNIDYKTLSYDGQNIQVFTLACCCIILDEALADTLPQRDPASKDKVFIAWSIIYQLRNAFAHSPMTPKWRPKRSYQRHYQIKLYTQNISLDLNILNNELFELYQIGGALSLFELIEYCKKEVISRT